VVVLDVLAMVRVSKRALAPLICAEAGMLQVIGLDAPVGVVVTAQVRSTAPVNPFDGKIPNHDVFPEAAPAATLAAGPLIMVKPGVGAMPPLTTAERARVWT
jgi:hypothetical protein